MNVIKYKTEYLEQVIDLLKNTPNCVYPSEKVFTEIEKQLKNEADAQKLDKLFRKAYTALAVDNDTLVGIAAMDKEGYLGILTECDKKAQKRLLDALERRAEKTEIPQLFVQPVEDCSGIFIKHGYKELNEGDDFNLIKEISSNVKNDLKPENVKTYTLNPNKPIILEGKRSVFPFFFFGINVFFMIILTMLSVTEYPNAFAENDTNYITVFIVFTTLFVISLAIFVGYFVRQAILKKEVLSMRVTNGIIKSFATLKTRSADDTPVGPMTTFPAFTHVFITYVYYDENMVKREGKYDRKYRYSGPYFYEGQELVIACASEKSYVLSSYTIENPLADEEQTPVSVSDIPQDVNEKTLSKYVPIKATKNYYGHAAGYFLAWAIMVVIFWVLGIVIAHSTKRPMHEEIMQNFLFGSPFFVILGGFGIYTISIPLKEKRKYKKLLTSPNVKYTQGKIVHADKTFKSDNKMRFYCEFFDGNEKRRVLVPYRSASNMVKNGNTKVLVVFNHDTVVVLVKKGVYPDVFTFGYYRN